MPSASCLAAYTAASIVPADCGCDGTQSPEIRNSLLAEDPPSDSSPRSPPPAAWPTPPAAAFPPPCEAIPAEDGFVGRLHSLRFLHGCDPSYKAPDSYLGGTNSH